MHPSVRVLFAASAVAIALPASAADGPDRAPDWVKTPSARDLATVWPAKALKDGYGGKATLSCIVTVQGLLRACKVESEQPADGGFGSAALALSSQFLMKPAMKGGVAVEASVRIPINFPRPDKATGSRIKPVTDTDFRGEKVFTRLPWSEAPTYAEVLAAYPEKARAAKVGGTAQLDCRIDKEGRLSGCQVMKETPDGYGFGGAARALVNRFVVPVTGSSGETIAGAHVYLPVTFAASALEASVPAIGKPDWRAFPTMEDFTAVVSPAARKAAVYKARVVMNCTVGVQGALEACKAQSEEPVGLGYAEAAVRLGPYFRLGLWTDDGQPTVGGNVRVPLRFDLEAAMAGKPAP